MKDSTKSFIQTWWKATSIHDVIAYLRSIPKFASKTDAQLSTYANNQAAKLRRAEVPMKYLSGLKRGIVMEEIDKTEAMDFLKSIGIQKDELKEAVLEQKKQQETMAKRKKVMDAKGITPGRKAKKKEV